MDPINILADVMQYLDRTYCRGSIITWIRNTPEGAAYSIVRYLLREFIEEPGESSAPNRQARAA